MKFDNEQSKGELLSYAVVIGCMLLFGSALIFCLWVNEIGEKNSRRLTESSNSEIHWQMLVFAKGGDLNKIPSKHHYEVLSAVLVDKKATYQICDYKDRDLVYELVIENANEVFYIPCVFYVDTKVINGKNENYVPGPAPPHMWPANHEQRYVGWKEIH